MRSQGKTVGVMKPAETGCAVKGSGLYPKDASLLKRVCGTDDVMGAICPYCFSEPLSPAVAAKRAGKEVSEGLILRVCRTIARQNDAMIVEGAGGLMVPLSGKYLFLDLAADLKYPVVIVARAGLGTINHTLLTIAAARARGLEIYGIILNRSGAKEAGAAEKTNPDVLRELASTDRVFTLPYIPGVKRSNAALLAAGERLNGLGFFGLTKK